MSSSNAPRPATGVPSPHGGEGQGGGIAHKGGLARRALLLTLALSPLAACGFQPIYGENAAARVLLDATKLETPKGRTGFYLRDALRGRFGDKRAGETFLLKAGLRLEKTGLAITENDSITRFTVRGVSAYSLTRVADGKILQEGEVESLTAYSATASLFATRAAERDAERRLANALGERIAIRIAALTNAAAQPAG